MLFLDSSLSPDPTRSRQPIGRNDGWHELTVYPHAVTWCNQPARVESWGAALNLLSPATPLEISLGDLEEFDLVLDFGTELEGTFQMEVIAADAGQISLSFGESPWEAREWGPASICADQRPRKSIHRIATPGTQTISGETGGFRFARVRLVDFSRSLRIEHVSVAALFCGQKQLGDFETSDTLLQRIWHASVYTARLCTRPDAFWDGIKRDRHGWYGDARVTQETWDLTFHDPAPAFGMLSKLQTNAWANAIPSFSFDAIAMLENVLLHYGISLPEIKPIWERCTAFLNWVLSTQVNEEGMIAYCPGVDYQFGIGFTDWSPQPIGGRLEEWGPLQFAWLECLRRASRVAAWLDDSTASCMYQTRAEALRRILRTRFRTPGGAYHHTLNLCEPPETPWRMPLQAGLHYKATYEEGRKFGPSGASLHSCARAWWAGMIDRGEEKALVREGFGNPRLPQIITSYYYHYVTNAEAACGQARAALARLKGYFGPMLEDHDSATIWESYEPEESGIAHYSLHAWPKSLCHGWGSCTTGWVARWLAGLEILEPGYKKIRLRPAPDLGLEYSLTIPTPHGTLRLSNTGVSLPEGVYVEEAG